MTHYLLDLDGTLVDSGRALPGAVALVSRLQCQGVPFLVMTNSVRPPHAIQVELAQLGMVVEPSMILNPIVAINAYARRNGYRRLRVVGSAVEKQQVDGQLVDSQEDLIVLLDAERCNIDYQQLQSLVDSLRNGVPAVTATRSLFYRKNGSVRIDTGALVAVLEQVSSVPIPCLGKPSFEAFQGALSLWPDARIVVVGDDVTTDIQGAVRAGLDSVLVKTGKYSPGDEDLVPPGRVVSSLDELELSLDL